MYEVETKKVAKLLVQLAALDGGEEVAKSLLVQLTELEGKIDREIQRLTPAKLADKMAPNVAELTIEEKLAKAEEELAQLKDQAA